MPNVEVAVTWETITNQTISPSVANNRANSSAIQFIDKIYAQTKVYRFSADPLPVSVNVYYLVAAAGGAGAGDVHGPTRPWGGGPVYGISGGGGGGGYASGNVTMNFGTSTTVNIGGGAGGSGGSGGGSSASGPQLSVSLTGGGGSGNGPNAAGKPGGSGGGANAPAGTTVGTGIPGQGYPGGGAGGFIFCGGGGGGFSGAGGGAWAYFGGGGGGGISSSISGQSNVYSAGGRAGGDSGGQAGGPPATGGGGGAADYSGKPGVAYFSYPSTAPIGTGGSNIFLTADNRRVHQFTASGVFTLGPPPAMPDGTIVAANANETIRVTRVSVFNYDNTNLYCNVYYRKESANSNSFITLNKFLPRDSITHIIDSANVMYVANLDKLVLYCTIAP